MKAASPVTPHSPRSMFGMKFGKDFSSVGAVVVVAGVVVIVAGVVVVVGCFALSQQTFLSFLLQIRVLSLAKRDLYSELVIPFSAPSFFKSSTFELYETHVFRYRHV